MDLHQTYHIEVSSRLIQKSRIKNKNEYFKYFINFPTSKFLFNEFLNFLGQATIEIKY